MAKSTVLDTDSLQVIEKLVEDCSLAQIEQSHGRFGAMMILSSGMNELKKLLTDEFMVANVMPLMNSPLGFLTDKPSWNDASLYSVSVVRECLIEAVLRGLYPTNNQFNIIAKRCYVALNGFKFLLKRIPELTSIKIVPGVPKMHTDAEGKGGAVVRLECTIVYKEKKICMDRDFAIKVNKGMGADAIIGKAQRKMRKDIFEYVTGCAIPDGEAGDGESYGTDGIKNVDAVDLETGEIKPAKQLTGDRKKVNNVSRLKDAVDKKDKTDLDPTTPIEKSTGSQGTQGSNPSTSKEEKREQPDPSTAMDPGDETRELPLDAGDDQAASTPPVKVNPPAPSKPAEPAATKPATTTKTAKKEFKE